MCIRDRDIDIKHLGKDLARGLVRRVSKLGAECAHLMRLTPQIFELLRILAGPCGLVEFGVARLVVLAKELPV